MMVPAIPPLFQELTGVHLDRFPLVAERLAIDATDTLRAADSGLRGLRGRHLVRRLWHCVTGAGQELNVALGQDLLSMQRAALEIVREVMREEARTQYCVNRVLVNLTTLNHQFDRVVDRVDDLDQALTRPRVR